MRAMTQRLLDEIKELYTTDARDYRGRAVGPDHVTRHLLTGYHLAELVGLTKRARYRILAARYSLATDRLAPGKPLSRPMRCTHWGLLPLLKVVPRLRSLLFVVAEKPA